MVAVLFCYCSAVLQESTGRGIFMQKAHAELANGAIFFPYFETTNILYVTCTSKNFLMYSVKFLLNFVSASGLVICS